MHACRPRFVAAKVTGKGRRASNASLALTSMIDFLVVVVVFLLMTFNASAECPREVRVPFARNVLELVDAPTVLVDHGLLLLDGAVVGDTHAVEDFGKLQRIDALAAALRGKRDTWKQLHPGREAPGVVVLRLDRDTPAIVVKCIFLTASQAGFPNVSFMVEKAPG